MQKSLMIFLLFIFISFDIWSHDSIELTAGSVCVECVPIVTNLDLLSRPLNEFLDSRTQLSLQVDIDLTLALSSVQPHCNQYIFQDPNDLERHRWQLLLYRLLGEHFHDFDVMEIESPLGNLAYFIRVGEGEDSRFIAVFQDTNQGFHIVSSDFDMVLSDLNFTTLTPENIPRFFHPAASHSPRSSSTSNLQIPRDDEGQISGVPQLYFQLGGVSEVTVTPGEFASLDVVIGNSNEENDNHLYITSSFNVVDPLGRAILGNSESGDNRGGGRRDSLRMSSSVGYRFGCRYDVRVLGEVRERSSSIVGLIDIGQIVFDRDACDN